MAAGRGIGWRGRQAAGARAARAAAAVALLVVLALGRAVRAAFTPLAPAPRRGASRAASGRSANTVLRVSANGLTDAAVEVSTVEMPAALSEIDEAAAQEAALRYRKVSLRLPPSVAEEPVGATFIGPAAPPESRAPLVLLHGFDSSALEFRRLLPELEARGVPVYFLDLLGWGFGDAVGVKDFGPASKRAHLHAFWQQVLGGRPMALGGASLGGGIAIDFAAAYPEAVERMVMIDPQAFIDGAPTLGPLGFLGIQVLSSWPLRSMANQMAYFDKEKYATDDAIRIGRLHVELDTWSEASLNYLNSGGYTLSPLVSQVRVPTLLLWGEQDEILNGEENVPRFVEEIRGPVQAEWIAECGHVPHLEQPRRTAELIAAFLEG